MTSCLIIRGDGNREGDPIVNPLLTHESACIERGRIEIDTSTPAADIDIVIRLDTTWRRGDIAEVMDNILAPRFKSVVTSVSHRVDGPNSETKLVLWRPDQPPS